MKWYVAKIVFHIDINHGENSSQFDESLRLVHASSRTEAFHMARSIGKNEEGSFINDANEPVKWKFIDVCDVYAINSLEHGCEVSANTHVDEEAEAYISMVRHKAKLLLQHETILS